VQKWNLTIFITGMESGLATMLKIL